MKVFRLVRWLFRFDGEGVGGLGCLMWPLAMLGAICLLDITVEGIMERSCLARGFPELRRSYIGTSYCVRRVNQTDEVIPYHSSP